MFKNNKIYKIDKNGKKKRIFFIKGLKINFKGKDSTVYLHEPILKFKKSYIALGNNCTVSIKNSKHTAKKLFIYGIANNIKCNIGENFSCKNQTSILLHKEDKLAITIGDDCMFGSNVVLRSSDAHAIINIDTNKVTNLGKDITIGNHCWLAMNTTVLKGVNIKNNCVIATGSIVTKNCEEENSIYAGVPAKLVKKGITWNRETPQKYKNN